MIDKLGLHLWTGESMCGAILNIRPGVPRFKLWWEHLCNVKVWLFLSGVGFHPQTKHRCRRDMTTFSKMKIRPKSNKRIRSIYLIVYLRAKQHEWHIARFTHSHRVFFLLFMLKGNYLIDLITEGYL